MDPKMNKAQKNLINLYQNAEREISSVLSPSEAETRIVEFLQEVHAHPEEKIFLLSLFTDEIQKTHVPWELLQFCFHELRWSEILTVLKQKRLSEIGDPRARPIWDHLIDAFDDNWEDRTHFKSFRS